MDRASIFKKTDYYKSEEHLENTRDALKEAQKKKFTCPFCAEKFNSSSIVSHQPKCLYDPVNAKFCLECNSQFYNRENRFCGSKCSARYNNARRSSKSREKQRSTIMATLNIKDALNEDGTPRIKVRDRIQLNRDKIFGEGAGPASKVSFPNCIVCKKNFTLRSWSDHRKTCSPECSIQFQLDRPYQNGSRKTIKYISTQTGEIITLESSWELKVSETLDNLQIKWIRPEPIKWIDDVGKNRLYFPDFLLTDYDLYLDPKNPYCMQLDERKMQIVSQYITIKYGSLDYILEVIQNLI